MFEELLGALEDKYVRHMRKHAGTGRSKAYAKARFAQEYGPALCCLQCAKVCEDIAREKGWDLPDEYPPLADAIRCGDYSACVFKMQLAMFPHEDTGELTVKERAKYMRRAVDCSAIWILDKYFSGKNDRTGR